MGLPKFRRRMVRFLGVAIAGVLAIVLTNCAAGQQPAPPPTATGETAPAGTLVYGSGGQPVNLEPGNVTDGNSLIVQQQIYNRLLEFKPGTTELAPALATEWSSTPDGKTWTFKLRSGVKFHDGTPFDAAAVVFNVGRWWDPNHPNGYRNAGKSYEIWQQIFGGFKGTPNALMETVTAVDPMTVRFVLRRPFAAFPSAIATGYFGMASPTAVQKAGAAYGTASAMAVGTGPFQFKEWRTGDRVVLTKNPNYWQPDLPQSEQLVIRFVTDPAARLAQLRAGQIDFTVDLAPDQRQELANDPNVQAIARPSFNVGYLALNPS